MPLATIIRSRTITTMISPLEGIERLRRGNHRYTSAQLDRKERDDEARRRELIKGQEPFVVILGCADSRVPAEIIFDQGLGDLFVIRVAGNVAGQIEVGSIEYAVGVLGVQLVVVLGHSSCGAVQATLAEMDNPSQQLSPGLQAIISEIQPAVAGLPAPEQDDNGVHLEHAVQANVLHSMNRLHEESALIRQRSAEDDFMVVGAVYSLETGEVDFI